MKLHHLSWRKTVAAVATVVLAAGLMTACGSKQESAPAADGVTITHKFGETKVPANPSRVVTVGWTDQDFVLPFGVVPVSTREFFEEYNDYPWVKAATDGKGVTTWGADEIDFEAIAKQKPDVIFAIYETIDKQTYERLSQIAPTVIQSADYPDEETPWDVQLLTTGKALGKEAEAKELVGKVQGRIDEARKANPEFDGKTLVVDFGPEAGGHYLLPENDPRRSLVHRTGLHHPGRRRRRQRGEAGPSRSRRAVRQRCDEAADALLTRLLPARSGSRRPHSVHRVRVQPQRRADLQRARCAAVRARRADPAAGQCAQRQAGGGPGERPSLPPSRVAVARVEMRAVSPAAFRSGDRR